MKSPVMGMQIYSGLQENAKLLAKVALSSDRLLSYILKGKKYYLILASVCISLVSNGLEHRMFM